jgi:hypothetical protein
MDFNSISFASRSILFVSLSVPPPCIVHHAKLFDDVFVALRSDDDEREAQEETCVEVNCLLNIEL